MLKSGTLRLEQISEGFDRLADGAVVRRILLPHSQASGGRQHDHHDSGGEQHRSAKPPDHRALAQHHAAEQH